MRREKRRGKNEENQETGGWLLTYADMITLVLTFFILLYTMSTLDIIKFSQVVASVKGSLGVIDGGRTLDTENQNDLGQLESEIWQLLKELEDEEEAIKQAVTNLEMLLEAENIQDAVSILVDERGINIRFLDHILFDLGSAELKSEARPLLDKIYSILIELNNEIRVEGYTCDLPIRTGQFPSNWELSTRRATTVVRYLEGKGLAGEVLSAVGYGEYRPLVPNTSELNRRQNRRVDIVILRGKIRFE
ncbi:MAG: flagellar motor protein MotB [Clostridia bacterium]|jgi:chemotaxis protein MotB|nr:flagellar motor protein MotB [Clostridia bacterium]